MLRWVAAAATALLLVAETSSAHEIPSQVTVRVFVKPEADTLQVLVRVPLEAMRDMSVPVRAQGYLDLSRVGPVLEDAAILWISDYMELFEEGRPLANPRLGRTRVSLPSDRAFDAYETARQHVAGPPLSEDTEIFWEQALLDAAFEYDIASEDSSFAIDPGLERLGIQVINVLRFIRPDGQVRAFDFPGNPGRIPLEPRWHQVFFRFVSLGFFHILDGLDHLLFLFCLVIPFRNLRALIILVTSFTVAHSITLAFAAFGYAPDALWFPPLVETLIAISIIYMAFENIVGARLRRRWVVTFGFGLIHGFGFSFLLQETLQFAGAHLATSLLAFNVGVELGQLLVLALVVPLLGLFFRFGVKERLGTIYLSALVTHSAWHWMEERLGQLQQFSWANVGADALASALRLAMVLVAIAAAIWLASVLRDNQTSTENAEESESA